METDYKNLPWRIGRKLGRTIYVQLGEFPSDDDPIIGIMDTKELAETAVLQHNKMLESN